MPSSREASPRALVRIDTSIDQVDFDSSFQIHKTNVTVDVYLAVQPDNEGLCNLSNHHGILELINLIGHVPQQRTERKEAKEEARHGKS